MNQSAQRNGLGPELVPSSVMEDMYNGENSFTPAEIQFQQCLVETDFTHVAIHDCLSLVTELIEAFVNLKENLWHIPEKRYGLLVILQFLKAKNGMLMDRCFDDPDALARFFFLHERISSILSRLSEFEDEKNPQEGVEVDLEPSCSAIAEESSCTEAGGFECPICYIDCNHDDTYRIKACNHRYCKECLIQYYTIIINGGGNICNITCPDSACETIVSDKELRDVLDASTMDKYERFSLLSYFNSNPNAYWCPYKNCDSAMILEPGSINVRCDTCYRSSCVVCKTIAHSGMTCAENQVSKAPEDDKMMKWKRKHGVKNCPHCKTPTIRRSGCPDMICSTCHLHWDWFSVGEEQKESKIERIGFYYPRKVKTILGSRDVHEDWKKDKKGTALYLTPFVVASTVFGIPLFCITGPPAYLKKKLRQRNQKKKEAAPSEILAAEPL